MMHGNSNINYYYYFKVLDSKFLNKFFPKHAIGTVYFRINILVYIFILFIYLFLIYLLLFSETDSGPNCTTFDDEMIKEYII